MTLEEIKALSNDELNRALQIAFRGEVVEPIDYCRDLNAIQADETIVLTPEQWGDYVILIDNCIWKENEEQILSLLGNDATEMAILTGLIATARQRAECLLYMFETKGE
jgi:hypothetical protein